MLSFRLIGLTVVFVVFVVVVVVVVVGRVFYNTEIGIASLFVI